MPLKDYTFLLVCCFPARVVRVLQVGCRCCCAAYVASVVTQCVRAVVVRLALDSLAEVFPVWRTRVFLERCLGGSGGGSPRTGLRCFCSSTCCSVLYNGLCCLVVGLCVLVKVLPRIVLLSLLTKVLPRSALCSFCATVVLPLWFKVCCLVGLHSSEVLPEWLLALLVEVLPKTTLCCFEMSCCCCRVDCLCYSLLGRCQSRCCALDRASGCCVGQLVSLFVSKFFSAVLVDFVCPKGTVAIEVVLLALAYWGVAVVFAPVRQSQCSVFCVLLGADVVVALLK
ncbi:hypothetical protein Taro_028030 [Colocasia esculenta]|uniref:Uncharacterized protein n=1 Tax=Colocasia esculenta TaxID=4460 RepID=A0A843VQK6_COLES|nr:hypothetical protein [Colocasia esculenta]